MKIQYRVFQLGLSTSRANKALKSTLEQNGKVTASDDLSHPRNQDRHTLAGAVLACQRIGIQVLADVAKVIGQRFGSLAHKREIEWVAVGVVDRVDNTVVAALDAPSGTGQGVRRA